MNEITLTAADKVLQTHAHELFKSLGVDPTPQMVGNVIRSLRKLRDKFAGQALQGMLSSGFEPTEKQVKDKGGVTDFFAYAAYRYADAMLEARK